MYEGIHIHVIRVVFSPMSTKILMRFQDVRRNRFHLHTIEDDLQELLHILSHDGCSIEDISTYTFGLYIISLIYSLKGEITVSCVNRWHERIRHLEGLTMRRIIPNTKGHEIQALIFLKGMKPCEFYTLEKKLSLDLIDEITP